MNRYKDTKHTLVPVAFVLILFVLLCLLSGAVIISGGDVYESITDRMDANYEKRVAQAYLTTKIRQNDIDSAIYEYEKDGVKYLAIEEDILGEKYLTCLYFFEGAVRELFMEYSGGEIIDFSPSDGYEVLKLRHMDFEISGDFVTFNIVTVDGAQKSINLTLRAAS